MTLRFVPVTLVLLAGAGACSGKTLNGGSSDPDAAAAAAATDDDSGGGEEGGPTATSEGGATATPEGGVNHRTLGESCDDVNGCIDGLACLGFAVHPAGEPCQVVGRQCTVACMAGTEGDAICQALRPKYKCFRGCGDDFSCANTL